ncbi:MAG TPA: cytochrome b/b6 domain-containing protein [Marinospirillum sp.]|uniref:cytochrome b/b6 domain-containing protein n=1 Tax=Marinospirillum sp. TaxID=2183934 RepID=UPI002B46F487|nr:cytochrome b/b6 domain-containing protein [Marinospirillum sp.]HKM16174.1 cytochrome b/b6 domain-containing protein [Marinospirillum sp.]
MTQPNSTKSIKVWDWSIRVFHWSLPVLIFLLWFSQDQGEMDRHFLLGQVLLGMLVYRFIWGFIGTPYARFKHFLYGPKAFIHYAKNFFSSNKPRYLSHNPPGGFMVLVLLGAVSFQLVTGLFTTDDIFFSGPLYDSVSSSVSEWMTKWHYTFFNGLLVLIGLHLFAIALYKWLGEGLVKAMFSGEKEASIKDKDLLAANVLQESFPWARFAVAIVIAATVVISVFY